MDNPPATFASHPPASLEAHRALGTGGGERHAEAQVSSQDQAAPLQHLREGHTHPPGLERAAGDPAPLLASPPGGHDGRTGASPVSGPVPREKSEPDLGDLMIVLLSGTLDGLRDRLAAEGFTEAAALVGDLAEAADHYASRKLSGPREN
jgi:hypothetical protein